MKRLLSQCGQMLLLILCTPLFLLLGLGLLVFLPVDYVKYRRSLFYKDTKQKYQAYGGTTAFVKLYDIIQRAELPIQFVCHPTYNLANNYFYYKNTLIVHDWTPHFDKEQATWVAWPPSREHSGDAVDMPAVFQIELEEFNKNPGHPPCDWAVVLVPRSELTELDMAHLGDVDFIIAYDERQEAEALRKLVETVDKQP